MAPIFVTSHGQKETRTLYAFMHTIGRGDFSPNGDPVKGDTTKTTMNNVAATTVASSCGDLLLDDTNNTSPLVKRQTQSFKKVDPQTKYQKAIRLEDYRSILQRAHHPQGRAMAELLCGDLLYAAQSYELYAAAPSSSKPYLC